MNLTSKYLYINDIAKTQIIKTLIVYCYEKMRSFKLMLFM